MNMSRFDSASRKVFAVAVELARERNRDTPLVHGGDVQRALGLLYPLESPATVGLSPFLASRLATVAGAVTVGRLDAAFEDAGVR